MDADLEALPDDVGALKAELLIAREKERLAEARKDVVVAEKDAAVAAMNAVAAELAVATAKASDDQALIAHQKLRIAKLERQIYGQRSEHGSRLVDQLELRLEEAEAAATEDELAAEMAVAKATTVAGFTRRRPIERNTFPEHLPRERVVIDPPTACECCGGTRLRKLGEDVTQTLEVIPRSWKVIETVREKFTCRDCEKISLASGKVLERRMECDLKPFEAIQRVRPPPGRGAARQPEASLAWGTATSLVKRRQRMLKPWGSPDIFGTLRSSVWLNRERCRQGRQRRGLVGLAGVLEQGKGIGWVARKPERSRTRPRVQPAGDRDAG